MITAGKWQVNGGMKGRQKKVKNQDTGAWRVKSQKREEKQCIIKK